MKDGLACLTYLKELLIPFSPLIIQILKNSIKSA